MSEILHLNLHREFFAGIANKQKRIEYRKQSPYWRKRLEGQNMTRSCSVMGMRKMRRKCWWNFAGCVVMEKGATRTMPFALGAY
jgi:hypothetical protein